MSQPSRLLLPGMDSRAELNPATPDVPEPPVWFPVKLRKVSNPYVAENKGGKSGRKSSVRQRRQQASQASQAVMQAARSAAVAQQEKVPQQKETGEDCGEQSRWNLWWLGFRSWLRNWFTGSGGRATAVSTGIHATILLILTLLIVNANRQEEVVTTVLPPDEDLVTFEEIDTEFDLVPEAEAFDPLHEKLLAEPAALEAVSVDGLQKPVTGPDIADVNGGDQIALPKRFFTKGSFTVWTEPADPAPGQNYLIIVRINLENASIQGKRYPLNDLHGFLTGTDGYRQVFPGFPGQHSGVELPIRNGHADFEVFVPGAYQLVKDTISVRSTMLKEEQTIEIVF